MLEIIAREVWVAPIVKVDEGFPHTENIIFFYQKRWLDSFHLSFFLIKHDTKDSSQVPWNHSPTKKTSDLITLYEPHNHNFFPQKSDIVAKCYILVWYSMETFFISQGQCTQGLEGWHYMSSKALAFLTLFWAFLRFLMHAYYLLTTQRAGLALLDERIN